MPHLNFKSVKSFGIYEHIGVISLKILQSFNIFKSVATILTKILQSFCWSESARAEASATSSLKSRPPPPQRPRRSRHHPSRRPNQSPSLLPSRVRQRCGNAQCSQPHPSRRANSKERSPPSIPCRHQFFFDPHTYSRWTLCEISR